MFLFEHYDVIYTGRPAERLLAPPSPFTSRIGQSLRAGWAGCGIAHTHFSTHKAIRKGLNWTLLQLIKIRTYFLIEKTIEKKLVKWQLDKNAENVNDIGDKNVNKFTFRCTSVLLSKSIIFWSTLEKYFVQNMQK